jgi:hydroxyacid-oxoacid transhydrogenase
MCPERHLEGAEMLGHDTRNAHRADAGAILASVLLDFMDKMKVPNGLSSLGYTKADIPGLVKGALPQERVNKLAPRPQTEEDLQGIYEHSMTVY